MALAFKEWSYIVDALGKGKQSIILRKGGISEEGGDFVVKGTKFLLLPTLYHQAEEIIKPQWLPFLKGDKFNTPDNKAKILYYVEVVDAKLITDYSIVKKLDQYHAWKDEIIQERFNRWNKSVHLLVTQVFELLTPVEIEMTPEYAGCKSWVELKEEVEMLGKPILNKMII
jgi:hypothetical protein